MTDIPTRPQIAVDSVCIGVRAREARRLAAQQHNNRTADYLLGIPLLADYLEEGLAQFDLSCADFEGGHLSTPVTRN